MEEQDSKPGVWEDSKVAAAAAEAVASGKREAEEVGAGSAAKKARLEQEQA